MAEGGTDIVKRHGRRPTEAFDADKLRKSIEAACLTAGQAPGQAENTARTVVREVSEWLGAHHEVTSHDLRLIAAKTLKRHHPDAAYLYEQHRITL